MLGVSQIKKDIIFIKDELKKLKKLVSNSDDNPEDIQDDPEDIQDDPEDIQDDPEDIQDDACDDTGILKYGFPSVKQCVYENKDENPYPNNPHCIFDTNLNAWINTAFIRETSLDVDPEDLKGVYLNYRGYN